MMNEWGLPTVALESTVAGILKKLAAEGLDLPAVAIAGGFTMEDQVYKALALGAPTSALWACAGPPWRQPPVPKKSGSLLRPEKRRPILPRWAAR